MPARDPRTRRYPCEWCGRPDMWPDLCSEAPDAVDPECVRRIERRCMLGDHRRCAIDSCVVAERWHEEVRQAAVEAATAAGKLWAVVSTIENGVDVVGTEDNLGRAKTIRATVLRRSGRLVDSVGVGLVYVVRATDGGFL